MIRSHPSGLLSRVFTTPRSFVRYQDYCTPGQYRAIVERAQGLRGLRLVEVSSSAQGGEDAQQLQSVIPCLSGLGLDVRWYSLRDDPSFFAVTYKLERLLEGDDGHLTATDVDLYRRLTATLAEQVDQFGADLLVIHGVPAAGVPSRMRSRPRAGVLWRSYLDLRRPNVSARSFMQPFWQSYSSIVLQFPEFQVAGLAGSGRRFFAGAMDPLTLRNQLIDREAARQAMAQLGIDPQRPVITQVGGLTANNEPLGLIDAFRRARSTVPGLQLALLATIASHEDPTVPATTASVLATVRGDADIHVYTAPRETGPLPIDAFQTGSEAVAVCTRHGGFGISASEAMWKGNAVVGWETGGLREQIVDGESGFLVRSVDECADRLICLVRDRSLAERLGQRAHQTVADRFLLPRLLSDWLTLFADVSTQPLRRVA